MGAQAMTLESTGSGSARHDLAELQSRAPSTTGRPIVFYVLLAGDNEKMPPETHADQVRHAAANSLPTVSAVLAAVAFCDARGGRIQRQIDTIAVNRGPMTVRPYEEGQRWYDTVRVGSPS